MARDILDEESQIPEVAAPPQVGIPPRKSLGEIRADAAARLAESGFAPQATEPDTSGLDDLLHKVSTFGQTPLKEHTWSGTGRAALSGVAGLGAQVAGAGEYAASRLGDYKLSQGLHNIRQGAQNFAQAQIEKLTPEEQDEMARQWTSLDPHQTIWQGGAAQFVHSVALQAAQAAPATVAMLWPMSRMVRAGMTNGALTYVGATQAGLSMGQIANNISDDIMRADESTLRQNSPRYSAMVQQGMDLAEARQQLIQEAQKYAPVVGGLVSGAISTAAGRFLTPVLSKEGASLGARLVGGAVDQAIQGGGTAGADYVARETAAHTYDSKRAPDLVGTIQATGEGAATGALQGAAFGALAGRSKRPTQPELGSINQNPGEHHATMEGSPENKATGAASEEHVNDLAAHTDDYAPVDRGRPEESVTPEGQPVQIPPALHPGSQSEMDLPQGPSGVDPAIAAAIHAKHGDVAHWGAEPEGSGYQGAPPPEVQAEEPAWAGPAAIAQRNEQLPLQGGQMNPPRPGPTPPANVPGQLNIPFQERLPGLGRQPMQPMVEPPRTRADELRARAAQPTPDENQPDLFRDQPIPGQLTTRGNRPLLAGNPDLPSAEPFADIHAQLKDLVDPQHERGGVYLSADNIARLRRDGLLDQVRASAGEQAVPLVNFDEKGGTLIAKDQEHADLYTHYRDKKVGSMQEILGEATGAGTGKPEGGNFVVQQHDDQGNVTRETGVATEEEGRQLAERYADVARGRTAQVLTAPAAVLRRAQLIGLEREQIERTQAEKGAQREVSRAVGSGITGDQALQARAVAATRRDLASGEVSPPVSREEAARRLTAEARRVHNEARTRTWPGTGVIDPADLVFVSPDAARKYGELYHEFVGSQVMRRSTVHPEDAEKGRVGQEIAERRIATFLKTHAHETKAEQVARAAVTVSREGVKEYLANKRAPGREYTEPHQTFNPEALEPEPHPTRAQVHELNETELERLYNDVINRSTANPRSTLTRDQILTEDEGVRSKQEKRINRFYRSLAKNEELGNATSEKFAVSPRRALTEREQRLNAAKNRLQKKVVGYKTFDPEALISTVESQREMERAATMTPEEQKAERIAQYRSLSNAIKRGETHLEELMPLKREHLQGESPLMAQKYMRELLQYGRVLKGQSLRSPEARAAAKKFTTLIDALGNKQAIPRAQYLIGTFKTELARQDRSAARANPERPGMAPLREEQIGRANTRLAREAGERAARFEGEDAFINRLNHEIDVENVRAGIRPEQRSAETTLGLRDLGNQMDLRFPEAVQPKFGYEGAGRREPEPPLEFGEAPRQEEYPLGYRSVGQAFADLPRDTAAGAPYIRNAEANASRVGRALGELLESNERGPVSGPKVIHEVLSNLRPGNPMHDLFSKLQNVVGKDTLVGYAGRNAFSKATHFGNTRFAEQGPEVRINRDHLDYIRATGRDPEAELAYTVAHELSHVATSGELFKNQGLARQMEGYLAVARQHGTAAEHYGLTNIHEMVAEAYSNNKFRNFLKNIEAPHNTTLWDHVIRFFKSVLGMDKNEATSNLFDKIMSHEEEMFTGRRFVRTAGEHARAELNLEDRDEAHVGNGFDRLMKSVNIDKQTVHNLATDLTQGFGQKQLSAMTPRQQSDHYSRYFQKTDGTNPYKRYWDTFFKRAADNAVSMEKVGKLSNTWSNLEERFGPDQAMALTKLMNDATLYQFHPDVALTHESNEHLVSEAQKARQREGAAVYNKMDPALQEHYKAMKRYYASEQRNTTDQIVLNGLHAMLTKGEDAAMTPKDFDAKYDAETVRRLGLDTHEGLQKEFGDKLSGASIDTLTKIGSLTTRNGPYFPLMRNGDYVVSSSRKVGSKEFDEGSAAQKYAGEQRQNDPTLSVSVKKTANGIYRVSVVEKEVRMAESRSEANQHRREMAAQYGEENTSPVQLKADLYKGEASITTGSALDHLMHELKDNPAAQTAVKDFYLRTLGDQSFRKRELMRSNRRGVDPGNQHRSFAQYGRSQSYYLSQLKYGRHLANAQGEIQAAVSAHRDESEISAVRMGELARELALRDEISRNPYKVSDLVRRGTSLTQFMMLTSPSHWFVRGAQPYVLSAPWLGARHGFADSVAALGRAQAMIADPLLKETASSGLGLKALFSRAAAEKSYSVMEQIMAHVKATAGKDAAPINAMLQHLRDNNLIDLSMATELSDISKGRSTGLTARVLDASRIMLHLIEVNNRSMTAIAARELGLKAGMTEAQAVEHAADAINVTHNDYSYGNTPRMFMAQSKGLLGGARPLLFQFMKYPQQVYGMMISSGLAALKGKTPQERAIGVKTLAGVLATHLLAAGAVGATIQPIKWAFGALMAGASAAGMTDEPYTVANALSGQTYDNMLREVMNELFGTELGELVSKGLPTALGVDLSQRMALGATYSFHLKTDSDASTLGSIAESVGGPWLNVSENFYDAGKSFVNGDVVKGIQQMSPHLIRDLVKAGQMSQEGVVNNAGTVLIPADKLSGGELFAQSLGFRPDQIAETLNRNNAERSELQNIQDQRKALIQKYVAAEPNDRAAVRAQVLEFSAKHPAFHIDAATLLRASAQQAAAALELQKYGVRAKARQLPELRGAGAPFNVQ